VGTVLLASVVLSAGASAETLRVLTFNLWQGGEAGGQPLSQSIAVIRAAEADVAGLQETLGAAQGAERPDNGRRIAESLGWNYHDQGGGKGIASRHPIIAPTPEGHGAVIRLPSGREVGMFNVHLAHAPYQPYQLLGIPYADAPFLETAPQAIRAAREARGDQVKSLISELRAIGRTGRPILLTGDFNEPSHLDWTRRAARAGLCPMPVRYPTTRAVMRQGLRDAFRTVHPDEVARPGWTWTPITAPDDPRDRHDRIDMVFFRGPRICVTRCEVVGESPVTADRVVSPYPSDHRAVVATLVVGEPAVGKSRGKTDRPAGEAR
jgi:endonuclease/exonuclease/phosphatase family metal-dependent hydrolase